MARMSPKAQSEARDKKPAVSPSAGDSAAGVYSRVRNVPKPSAKEIQQMREREFIRKNPTTTI